MNKIVSTFAMAAFLSTAALAEDNANVKEFGGDIFGKVVQQAQAQSIDKIYQEVLKALPDVLVTYGEGKQITKKDMENEFNSIKGFFANVPANQLQNIDADRVSLLLKQAVEGKLISTLLEDAIKKDNFQADQSIIKQELENISKQPGIQEVLKMQNITMEQFGEQLTKEMTIQQWLEKTVISKIEIKEEAIKGFYEENLQVYFTKPAGREVSHILVKNDDDAKAKAEIEDIAKQLKDGAKFEELAAKYSICPSGKDAQGSIGFVANNATNIDATFLEVANKLTAGQVSEPVKTQFGYHIIRVDSVSDESVVPYEEAKENIKNFLIREQTQVKIHEKIDELQKAANVKFAI